MARTVRPKKKPDRRPTCPCGAPMEKQDGKYGPFYGCTDYPECSYIWACGRNGQTIGVPRDKDMRMAQKALREAIYDTMRDRNASKHDEDYETWQEVKDNLTDEEINDMSVERCHELIEELEEG